MLEPDRGDRDDQGDSGVPDARGWQDNHRGCGDSYRCGVQGPWEACGYNNLHLGSHFFRSFFELLIGRDYVRRMIMEGASADEIRAMWTNDIIFFKEQRKPYLLYEE